MVGILVLRGGAVALALCVSSACATTQLDYANLPSDEALRSIRVGETTRIEVLRVLGPPEEMRRPTNWDRARKTTPQHRRILEERRIYGDDAYTYVAGRRSDLTLGIFPVGPAFLEVSTTQSLEDRWRFEFDQEGVVSSISHVDEFGSQSKTDSGATQ